MVLASVVIPAHNESAVVARCLQQLLRDATADEFDVVVVANGCSDDTAGAAQRAAHSLGPAGERVTVLERSEPGKIGALNAGDAAVTAFPRIYLDADAVLTTAAARATAAVLADGAADAPLAAAPRPRVASAAGARLVRWYYEAWVQLPVIRDRYVGSGVYAVSRLGHARIAPFPDVIADDHYVRLSFAPHERASVEATFELHPARTVSSHIRRAVRVRAGNAALDAPPTPGALAGEESSPRGVRGALPLLLRPTMWHRVAAFAAISALVRIELRRTRGRPTGWNHDASSRIAEGAAA